MTPFFQLIQIAIGRKTSLDAPLSESQWEEVQAEARRQALDGVIFDAVQSLPLDQMPPKDLLRSWAGRVVKIELKNETQSMRAKELTEMFSSAGMLSCILKGQGTARRYPNPKARVCGDIDIWVPGKRAVTVTFLRERCPKAPVVYHHTKAKLFTDTDVEVHFTPSWMFNPFKNKRLQHFFSDAAPVQCFNLLEGKGFAAPNNSFDAIFILVHIYRHLLDEGVGLRQLMDYYFVLKQLTSDEREKAAALLKPLGLQKIAAATMFALQQCFALEEESMIAKPDSNEGEFLLREIMQAGNFGRHDSRTKGIDKGIAPARFLKKFKFQLRLLTHYPGEILWAPVFKTWQFFWRLIKGYK